MAKTSKTAEELGKEITTLISALVALGKPSGKPLKDEEAGDEESSVDIPSAKEIKKLDKKGVLGLCQQLSIDTEDKEDPDLREVLTLLSRHAADEELDEDEAKQLVEGLGLTVSKNHKKNLAAISEYIQADNTSEEDDDEKEKEDDDSEDDKKDESEDDEEKSEDDSDDKEDDDSEEDDDKKSKKSDDDEEEDDEEKSEDDDEEKDEKSEEDEEEEADEVEEIDDKTKKKRLDAYNKVADKELKTYAKLEERLTDDDGDVAKWKEPYVKDEEFFCCGMPLEDVEHNGKEAGKCQVTDTIFVQDKKGNLKPVE